MNFGYLYLSRDFSITSKLQNKQTVVIVFLYYLINSCRITSDVFYFIPELGDYILSLFKTIIYLFSQRFINFIKTFQKQLSVLLIFLCFSLLYIIHIFFYLHYFFPSSFLSLTCFIFFQCLKVENYSVDQKIFFFHNINISCIQFLLSTTLDAFLKNLMCYIFIFNQFKIFSNVQCDFSLAFVLLEVSCFIFNYLETFLVFFCY